MAWKLRSRARSEAIFSPPDRRNGTLSSDKLSGAEPEFPTVQGSAGVGAPQRQLAPDCENGRYRKLSCFLNYVPRF